MGQLQSFQGLDFFYIKLSVLTEAATTLWNQNAFKESHQGCRQNLQTIFIFLLFLALHSALDFQCATHAQEQGKAEGDISSIIESVLEIF